MVRISTRKRKSRMRGLTSTVPMVCRLFQRLPVSGRMDRAGGGQVVVVVGVAAAGDRVRVRVARRRVAAIANTFSLLTMKAARLRGLCVCGMDTRWLLFLALLFGSLRFGLAQSGDAQKIEDGVWFLLGDASKGYSNTAVIEMKDYLIVVDANYPGRAKELLEVVKGLSK